MSNKTQTITYQVTVNGNRQEWWLYGKCHRLDGPAVINGKYQAWYIEGKSYTKKEFDEKIKET